MATNYWKWEGTRRNSRWEKPALLILAAVVLASGAHAYTSYQRHTVAAEHCARGERAWCAGRMTEAEREFAAALASDPHLFSARDQLAIIAWQQGDMERSIALLRQGVRLHPDAADAHRALGETLFLARDFAGAIPALEAAERMQPTEPGRPSLLKTCKQALVDPPAARREPGAWTGLRTHAKIHPAGDHHACQGDHAHSDGTTAHNHDRTRPGTAHTD